MTWSSAGADGIPICAFITTLADAGEMHPAALVTVKEYVPAASPDIVLLAPDPAIAPGLIVQLPAGKPVSTTLPVDEEQSGWVIAPKAGAVGVTG